MEELARAPEGIYFRAFAADVFGVTDDWMSFVGQMNANLMRAASFRQAANQRKTLLVEPLIVLDFFGTLP